MRGRLAYQVDKIFIAKYLGGKAARPEERRGVTIDAESTLNFPDL